MMNASSSPTKGFVAIMPRCRRFVPLAALALLAASPALPTAAGETKASSRSASARLASATYAVEQSLTIKNLPAGAKKVRIWFWLPQEEDAETHAQRVADLSVARAPDGYRITRDAANGHRYLYAEVTNPLPGAETRLDTAFTVRRKAVSVALDPEKSGPMTDGERAAFARDLRRDVPWMPVDVRAARLARQICKNETNPVRQARLLYDYVIDYAEHYSKGTTAPKSSNRGDAGYCLANGGGACTDLHALFSALARARGIPTRIHFGTRLTLQNENKPLDPGYRCWVTFYAPGHGWVPCDIAAGDTNPDKRDFYFGGLDERRILFSSGRDLDLVPRQDGPPVNLFIRAYVEVDGKPHADYERVLRFVERRAAIIKAARLAERKE